MIQKQEKKFYPYGKQLIKDNDIEKVIKVLKSDFITQGQAVVDFEKTLADNHGVKYAVLFNSGTSALHGAYFSLGLKKGDEFITTANTFSATSNAGLYLEAKPVFVDIEQETGNIDVSKIEENITSKTKMIAPVHYGGQPVDLAEIKKLADKYNLKIVEDACHAIGGSYQNTKIGSCYFSDMTIFSFHPVKHITTGEGGAVLTNNKEYFEKLKMFRTHGITKENMQNQNEGDWFYEMHFLGYNYRMTDIQAVLGLSQFQTLEENIKHRRKIASIYKTHFENNPYFEIPIEKENRISAYHLYPIRLKKKYFSKKQEIFKKLRANKIGVQTHYIPVYFHPYYRENGFKNTKLKNTEDFYYSEISIPMYHHLKEEEAVEIVKRIFDVFENIVL